MTENKQFIHCDQNQKKLVRSNKNYLAIIVLDLGSYAFLLVMSWYLILNQIRNLNV